MPSKTPKPYCNVLLMRCTWASSQATISPSIQIFSAFSITGRSMLGRRSLDHELPADGDSENSALVLQDGDIPKRIAVHHDEISKLAGFKAANTVIQLEEPGC